MDAVKSLYMDAKKKSVYIVGSKKGKKKIDYVMKSTEKLLKRSLKSAGKISKGGLAVLIKKVGSIIASPPPYQENLVFMTYIVRVDKKKPGWQKSIQTVLKKTKEVKHFQMDDRGRTIVSGLADLKLLLKGTAKASNAKLDYVQSGQCSSNLDVPPHVAINLGYGGGNYYGYGGGMFPFHGGYGGGHQQMGYGYNPMGYHHHNNYYGQGNMAFGYGHGSLMDDERMNTTCPFKF